MGTCPPSNDSDVSKDIPAEILLERRAVIKNCNGPSSNEEKSSNNVPEIATSSPRRGAKESKTNSVKDHNGTDTSASTGAESVSNELVESFNYKNFAETIHGLLSIPAYSSIIRWNSVGDAFAISNSAQFIDTILPKHFQGAKFDSFARRMRRWGFRRVESAEERMKGLMIYRCKHFLSDRPDWCKNMCDDRRKKHKRNQVAKSGNPPKRFDAQAYSSNQNGHQTMRHKEPVPVHYPSASGHPEDPSNNWNTMAAPYLPPPTYPSPFYPPMEVNQPTSQPAATYMMYYPQHPAYSTWGPLPHNVYNMRVPNQHQQHENQQHKKFMSMFPTPQQDRHNEAYPPGEMPPTRGFPEDHVRTSIHKNSEG